MGFSRRQIVASLISFFLAGCIKLTGKYPSYSGNVYISIDDYWKFSFEIRDSREIKYKVTNNDNMKYRFDTLLLTEEEFNDYKEMIEGKNSGVDYIDTLSELRVGQVATNSGKIPEGTYHLVIDNTSFFGAGVGGVEADRSLHVELRTYDIG